MILNFRHSPQDGEWEDVEQAISIANTRCDYGEYSNFLRFLWWYNSDYPAKWYV